MTDAAALARSPAAALAQAKRVVVKVGSSMACARETGEAASARLAGVAADVATLKARGCAVVIVSSGSIALGRAALGVAAKPKRLDEKQACAAAGQPVLMRAWAAAFQPHGLVTAQALLTLDDTERRRRWLNARATIDKLLSLGAVPIVNENDTVATDEIRYGDNDRLAARVAQMTGGDVLVLLSDVDGLYTADPRRDAGATRLDIVDAITPEIEAMAGGTGSEMGSGGMRSKVEAARIATAAGCAVAVAPGFVDKPLTALAEGGPATWFRAALSPAAARKRWIAGTLKPAGAVMLDEGAVTALKAGKSLLAVGVTAVEGGFEKGDAVLVRDASGAEIARGLVGYGAEDARRIAGKKSDEVAAILGYQGPSALIHRDDLVMTS